MRRFLFDAFCVGTSWRAPLAVLFFERAGPIGTGIFFFFFFFVFSYVFSFSPVYKKFKTVSNSEQISNGTKFEILNRFQMEQFFKFWTYFKWNNFWNSKQIFKWNKFSNFEHFFQMEQIFKFWTVSNNPKQYNVHSKVNEYMGQPTNGSPRASVGTRHKRRWIGAPLRCANRELLFDAFCVKSRASVYPFD
jgi:hypothetical protein